MFNYEQWDGFEGRLWKEEIIQEISFRRTIHHMTVMHHS